MGPSVWPDWAKFRHFVTLLKHSGHFESVHLVFAIIFSLIWQTSHVIVQIFIVFNGKILNKHYSHMVTLCHSQPLFSNMDHPRPLFCLFSYFWTNITIFKANKCEKCPSSIRCWDSNPRPLEYECPPITTRPGLSACLCSFSYFSSTILLKNCHLQRDSNSDHLTTWPRP